MEQLDNDNIDSQDHPYRRFILRHAIRTDVGKRRSENQDSYAFSQTPCASLYIVADGMGGARGGATASIMAVNVIAREAFSSSGTITVESLDAAVLKANALVFAFGNRDEELSGMGTTVVALAIAGDSAILSYVGDSRIYICRDGSITQLSRDHTLVQELVDSGAIDSSEAVNHPIAHMLTRSLGPLAAVDVETFQLEGGLKVGDKFLLCCDGLYNHVEADEMRVFLEENDINAAAQKLIDKANERGGTDNITVQVIEVVAELSDSAQKEYHGIGFDLVCSGSAQDVTTAIDFDDIDGIFVSLANEAGEIAKDNYGETEVNTENDVVDVGSALKTESTLESHETLDADVLEVGGDVSSGEVAHSDVNASVTASLITDPPIVEELIAEGPSAERLGSGDLSESGASNEVVCHNGEVNFIIKDVSDSDEQSLVEDELDETKTNLKSQQSGNKSLKIDAKSKGGKETPKKGKKAKKSQVNENQSKKQKSKEQRKTTQPKKDFSQVTTKTSQRSTTNILQSAIKAILLRKKTSALIAIVVCVAILIGKNQYGGFLLGANKIGQPKVEANPKAVISHVQKESIGEVSSSDLTSVSSSSSVTNAESSQNLSVQEASVVAQSSVGGGTVSDSKSSQSSESAWPIASVMSDISDDTNKEAIAKVIERATSVDVPEVKIPEAVQDRTTTSEPNQKIQWDKEAALVNEMRSGESSSAGIVDANSSVSDSVADSHATTIVGNPIMTQAEREAIRQRKVEIRSQISLIDAKMATFQFETRQEANGRIRELQEELKTVDLAVRQTTKKVDSMRRRYLIWVDRHQAFISRSRDMIVLAEEIALDSRAVAQVRSEYEAKRKRYMQIVAEYNKNPDLAPDMSAVGREFQAVRLTLEQTLAQAIEEAVGQIEKEIAMQQIVVEDLELRRIDINEQMNFLRAFTPVHSSRLRMKQQTQLLDTRTGLQSEIDGLEAKLPKGDEQAVRVNELVKKPEKVAQQ